MRKLFAILATVCLLTGMTSCEEVEGNETANYNYSSKKLDATSQRFKDEIIEADYKSSTSATSLKKFLEVFAKLEYEEYDGVVPAYSFRLDTTSIQSAKGFKTLQLKAQDDVDYNVIFVHGGGWTFRASEEHLYLCEKISDEIDADVYVPLYPMIPRWNYADAFEMLLEVYTMLQKQGKPVLLMGDSAGGNMVFGFAFYLREKGVQLPDYLIGISPALDLTASNKEMDRYVDKDIYIDRTVLNVAPQIWAGDRALTDPVISPSFGDPTGFPPTLLYVADEEIFYPDVKLFAAKCASNGVETSVLIGRGLWHVAPIYDIPVSDQFVDCLEDLID